MAMQAHRLAKACATGAKGDGHAKKKGNHTCRWAWSVRWVMGPVQAGNWACFVGLLAYKDGPHSWAKLEPNGPNV